MTDSKTIQAAALLLMAACTTQGDGPLVIDCEDRELNRGGSVHVIGPAVPGMVADVVWCGDDDSSTGFMCEDREWWMEDGEALTNCPVVGDEQDRGSLWVWVW